MSSQDRAVLNMSTDLARKVSAVISAALPLFSNHEAREAMFPKLTPKQRLAFLSCVGILCDTATVGEFKALGTDEFNRRMRQAVRRIAALGLALGSDPDEDEDGPPQPSLN